MTTRAETPMTTEQTAIRAMVVAWYQALDRHDPIDAVLPFLVDDGLEMRFPEETSRGHAGFTTWYERVTRIFFDEEHTVTDVRFVDAGDGDPDVGPGESLVKVVVNWKATIWNPPEPKSKWLGFDAYQTWVVAPTPDGPRVKTYVVDSLDPMPGSTPL